MKIKYYILTTLCIFFFTGCDDSSSISPTANCADLLTDVSMKSEAYMTAFMASIESGETMDETVCTSYSISAQAFLDGGCTVCEPDSEACLEDESNADTCCDEIDQSDVTLITAYCDNLASLSGSCNEAYVGNWVLTESGKYENADCTGTKIPSTQMGTMPVMTLASDCTQSVVDSFFCSDSSSEGYSTMCTSNWSSSGSTISIGAFGGLMVVDYLLNESGTEMTNTILATVGISATETEEQCQYSIYTKSN